MDHSYLTVPNFMGNSIGPKRVKQYSPQRAMKQAKATVAGLSKR